MIIINLWRRLSCFVVRYEITEKIASKPPYCNHRNDSLTLHIGTILKDSREAFKIVPRRPGSRAIRMIRLDNRDQTGESGCKTGIEWLSGRRSHKKSLKYRLLNTDNKVFTNIADLVTYHFTNSHVTIVTWVMWHHIALFYLENPPFWTYSRTPKSKYSKIHLYLRINIISETIFVIFVIWYDVTWYHMVSVIWYNIIFSISYVTMCILSISNQFFS